MLMIICGKDVEYTKGDTFELTITGDFDSNSQLDFIISESENSTPIIENTYQMNTEGGFTVKLTKDEEEALSYKNYMYKLRIHTPEGDIITQKSGNFKVKWGA